MIPIECPRCGKTGHVPPDRLGARLHCNRCQSIFHMNSGGRIVLGEPGASGTKMTEKLRPSLPSVEFDLARTWRDVPKPAKFAVPTAFILLTSWLWFPTSESFPYQEQAEVVARALVNGDRSRVVGLATSATAEAAGKWYDLMHASITENGSGPSANDPIRATLLSGNPERDASLGLVVVILGETLSTNFSLQMVKDDGRWKLDAAGTFIEAERVASTIKLATAKKK